MSLFYQSFDVDKFGMHRNTRLGETQGSVARRTPSTLFSHLGEMRPKRVSYQ